MNRDREDRANPACLPRHVPLVSAPVAKDGRHKGKEKKRLRAH